jgi:hypothetical protein
MHRRIATLGITLLTAAGIVQGGMAFAGTCPVTERIVLTIAAVVAAIALSFWQRTPRYRAKFDRAMAKRRAR